MKSIGRSTTLPEDVSDIEQAKGILMALADEIGMTARRHGKKGQTVHLSLKYADFKVMTRQVTIPATCTTRELYQAGCGLLEEHWSRLRPVRLIGMSLSGFQGESAAVQLSLFDPIESPAKSGKQEQLDKAMDAIRAKHGTEKITFATLVKKA